MSNNEPNDQDEFVVICKRVIYAGVLIILGLVATFIVEDIEHLPSDHPSQSVSPSQNTPIKQETAHQNTPQPANAPVSDTKEITIGFRVGGQITKMFFAELAEVKQGDILASLDKTPFEDAVKSAMAQLQTAKVNYINHLPTNSFNAIETAQTDVETAQHIYDVSYAELEKRGRMLIAGELDNVYNDDVQDEHDTKLNLEKMRRGLVQQKNTAANNPDRDDDKAAIQTAKNNLSNAEDNLTNTQLLAPSAGIIASRVSKVGDNVAAHAPVYILSVKTTENP